MVAFLAAAARAIAGARVAGAAGAMSKQFATSGATTPLRASMVKKFGTTTAAGDTTFTAGSVGKGVLKSVGESGARGPIPGRASAHGANRATLGSPVAPTTHGFYGIASLSGFGPLQINRVAPGRMGFTPAPAQPNTNEARATNPELESSIGQKLTNQGMNQAMANYNKTMGTLATTPGPPLERSTEPSGPQFAPMSANVAKKISMPTKPRRQNVGMTPGAAPEYEARLQNMQFEGPMMAPVYAQGNQPPMKWK